MPTLLSLMESKCLLFECSVDVENWDKFKYEMILNIEQKVSPSDARTVTSVRGEESNKRYLLKIPVYVRVVLRKMEYHQALRTQIIKQ